LIRLYDLQTLEEGVPADLTDAQREALLAALEHGYYDQPRRISLEELGELLEISPQAVGGRLRRGTANLIQTNLL
jgi:predicted DNA binding protein